MAERLNSSRLFCPTGFEIPKAFRKHTSTFGMGKTSAVRLAQDVQKSSDETNSPLIIFGCAGALRPGLKKGEVYLINTLCSKTSEWQLPNHEILRNFPTAKLYTSETFIQSAHEKAELFQKTRADLVDMEMAFFFDALPERLQSRCLFLRGVLDDAEDAVAFINPDAGINFRALLHPREWRAVYKFVRSYRAYLSGMDKALKNLIRNEDFTHMKSRA